MKSNNNKSRRLKSKVEVINDANDLSEEADEEEDEEEEVSVEVEQKPRAMRARPIPAP